MFCFQCEQTRHGTGCLTTGVCGKTPQTATLQDLLVYQLKGLACWAHAARAHGVVDPEVDSFVLEAAFSTLTNVNFDDAAFFGFLADAKRLPARIKAAALEHMPAPSWTWRSLAPHPAAIVPTMDVDPKHSFSLMSFGHLAGLDTHKRHLHNDTLFGVQELLMYGIKGLCAYAHHAERLGSKDEEVYAFAHEALAFLASPQAADLDKVFDMCMRCGTVNFKVMQLLDNGHRNRFGVPEPTEVRMTPVEGKCIAVSGHDMVDLHALLEQTQGRGINVYTHGELLPAHSYPGLKKYPHLVGNFGGAWYRQKIEFNRFPGAILMTTNCVLDPLHSYKDRLFTTGVTGVAVSKHVKAPDFSAVINKALEMPGFTAEDASGPVRTHTVGFGRETVLGVADKVLDAVSTGQLKHIFVIGGCDGNESQRKYYSRLNSQMPNETLVLTLGCGKFRLLDQDFGELGSTGLPRLLDMGQCNDAYSAVMVALKLAEALDTDVNSLPLSLDISWFEQKAVVALLTLLSLGMKRIRLGPKLPAFLTPEAIALLQEKFDLRPADLNMPEGYMQSMMEGK